MNKIQRGKFIGMVIGDAYLGTFHKSGIGCGISIVHKEENLDLLEYKKKIIDSLFPGKSKILKINNNGKSGYKFKRSNEKMKHWRKKIYPNGKKIISREILNLLNDEGLAIWWMDDGSLYMKKRQGKIHAREGILSTYLSLEENEIICKWFEEKYGIIGKPVRHKEHYRIRFNTQSLKKLIPIISKFIVPSMKYKVDMKYEQNVGTTHPTK